MTRCIRVKSSGSPGTLMGASNGPTITPWPRSASERSAPMSGPMSEAESGPADDVAVDDATSVEVFPSRTARVGWGVVQRALPLRRHRTIGPWCFLDHFGPETVTPESVMQVGPHPH